ncbi:hypothetical protein GCM10027360_78250 [Amycolatopsis echigonensis]
MIIVRAGFIMPYSPVLAWLLGFATKRYGRREPPSCLRGRIPGGEIQARVEGFLHPRIPLAPHDFEAVPP